MFWIFFYQLNNIFGKKRKLDNWIPENFVYIFEAKDLPSTTDDVMLDRVPSGQSYFGHTSSTTKMGVREEDQKVDFYN